MSEIGLAAIFTYSILKAHHFSRERMSNTNELPRLKYFGRCTLPKKQKFSIDIIHSLSILANKLLSCAYFKTLFLCKKKSLAHARPSFLVFTSLDIQHPCLNTILPCHHRKNDQPSLLEISLRISASHNRF